MSYKIKKKTIYVFRDKKKIVDKTTENIKNRNDSKGMQQNIMSTVTITYIQGLSERFKRIDIWLI